jgi:hypothetical protein
MITTLVPAVVRSAVPAISAGAKYVMKSTAGKTIGSVALFETAAAGWDWMFGSDAQDQAAVVEEILEVRERLNDPGTDPADLPELAAEDARLQEELEALGVSIAIEDTVPQQPNSQTPQEQSTGEMLFDPENDGQYTPDEFNRIRKSVNRVAQLGGMSERAVPMFLEEVMFLLNVGPDTIRKVIAI